MLSANDPVATLRARLARSRSGSPAEGGGARLSIYDDDDDDGRSVSSASSEVASDDGGYRASSPMNVSVAASEVPTEGAPSPSPRRDDRGNQIALSALSPDASPRRAREPERAAARRRRDDERREGERRRQRRLGNSAEDERDARTLLESVRAMRAGEPPSEDAASLLASLMRRAGMGGEGVGGAAGMKPFAYAPRAGVMGGGGAGDGGEEKQRETTTTTPSLASLRLPVREPPPSDAAETRRREREREKGWAKYLSGRGEYPGSGNGEP